MAGREKLVAFRISTTGLDYIDRLAELDGVGRSEMIRRLLSEAVTRRPPLPAKVEVSG